MYRTVPITSPTAVMSAELIARAIPKSVTFTRRIRREQQVAGFDIAVDDADVVGSAQRLRGLVEDGHDFVNGRAIISRQPIGERLTVDQLHDQERESLPVGDILGIVVNMSDSGVRQTGSEASLHLEPSAEVLRIDQVRAEQLDRHRPLEDPVGRLPHLSHPTDRDQLIEHIP